MVVIGMKLRSLGLFLLLVSLALPAHAEREILVEGFTGAAIDYVIKVDSLQALIELTADPERRLLQAIETEHCYLVAYRVDGNGLSILMIYKAGTTGYPLGGPSFENGTFLVGPGEFHSFVKYKVLKPHGSSTKSLVATIQRVPPNFRGYIEVVQRIRPSEDQELPKVEVPLKIYWE